MYCLNPIVWMYGKCKFRHYMQIRYNMYLWIWDIELTIIYSLVAWINHMDEDIVFAFLQWKQMSYSLNTSFIFHPKCILNAYKSQQCAHFKHAQHFIVWWYQREEFCSLLESHQWHAWNMNKTSTDRWQRHG